MKRNLPSQNMRTIAPEWDPLRLGTGWKREDLSRPQVMIESTFGDSRMEFVRREVSEPGISAPISAMGRAKEPMESTSPWLAGK